MLSPQPCSWNAHLAWLYAFCAPDETRIEADTGGKLKMCYDERDSSRPLATEVTVDSADAAIDPLRVLCFSFDWSGWSNNAALFSRQWWLHNLDDAAILTRDGNGVCVGAGVTVLGVSVAD
jgi:hypothetical protein